MADKSIIFKGTIKFDVDHALLQASVNLSKEGDELWDESKLLHQVAEIGISEGFDKENLIKAVLSFHKSREPQHSHVFARGEPPVPPRSEEIAWNEIPIPPELQLLGSKILEKSPPPTVYDIRTERIRNEKNPGEVETRTVREKILVDPKTEKWFFVEAGTVLATVYPPTPGKPGKDLHGRTIAPSTVSKAAFYRGASILRQKSELVSEVSGFVRIGKNWVDVVPFALHQWNLEFSEDKTNCYLNFIPGHPEAPKVSHRDVLDSLLKENFPLERVMDEMTLNALINSSVYTKKRIERKSITVDLDGSFEIRITPDQLKATLMIQKPLGAGKPLILKDLGEALKGAKLRGMNFEDVKAKIMDFIKGPDLLLSDLVLAQGKPPTRSKDRILEFLIDFITKEELDVINARVGASSRLRESIPLIETLPIEMVDKASEVSEGQKVALIKEDTEHQGEPGVDVFGEKIPPYPGNDPVINLVAGIRRHQNSLEAISSGLLDVAYKDNEVFMRIRPHENARVVLQKSRDNMEVTLFLSQARGSGTPLSMSLIEEALKQEQIYFGVDKPLLEEALNRAARGQRVENLVVARGRPPASDLSLRLKFVVPLKGGGGASLQSASVKEGSLVAEYTPPDSQQPDGMDVMGNAIPAAQAEIAYLKVGEKFRIEDKPQSRIQQIFSMANGEVTFDGTSLALREQKSLATGVNARTGNVKFPGAVAIEGDVERGFYVFAGGDLKIKGAVAAALLSSDANILIIGGVKGDGKAVLRAKKNIEATFIEKSVVLVVGDLMVQRTAMQCNIKCNGRILQKLSAGSVSGGLMKTKYGAEVMNLGHPNGTATQISFGQDYLVEDQIEAELKETEKLRAMILKLDDLMEKLSAPGDKEKLNEVRRKKVLAMKMLEKRNLKLIHLRDKFEAHFPSEIIIHEALFPGVLIESHGRIYEVKTRKNQLKIVFNLQTGHIEEKPLEA